MGRHSRAMAAWGNIAKSPVCSMMDIMETEQETTNADQSTHKLSQNLIEMGFSANAAQMAMAAVAPMDDEQLRQDIAMTWILDNEQMIKQKESDELVAKLAAEEEVDQEVQDDFLIAMQLQQQEDAEYIAARCVGYSVRVVGAEL